MPSIALFHSPNVFVEASASRSSRTHLQKHLFQASSRSISFWRFVWILRQNYFSQLSFRYTPTDLGHNRYQSVKLPAFPPRDALVCDLKKNVSEQLFCAVMPLCTDVATDPCSACRYVNSVSSLYLCAISDLFVAFVHERYQCQCLIS